jgi:hypothetical protein
VLCGRALRRRQLFAHFNPLAVAPPHLTDVHAAFDADVPNLINDLSAFGGEAVGVVEYFEHEFGPLFVSLNIVIHSVQSIVNHQSLIVPLPVAIWTVWMIVVVNNIVIEWLMRVKR